MFINKENRNSSETAIMDGYGNRFSYGYLEELAKEYGAVIESRSLVIILCDFEIDTLAFYYCMLVNHIVPILVDAKLDTEMLGELMERYQPQYIWKPMESESAALLKKGKHILERLHDEAIAIHKDLALLLSTSGSTGSSKLVRLTYANLLGNVRAFAEYTELQKDDVTITTLPFFYCYGLSVIHTHWYVGAAVCITDWPMTSEKFWKLFRESRITNFATVPYHYEILDRINFAGQDYPELRFLMEGGGKLPEDKQSFWGNILNSRNIRFYIIYGQTEGTSMLSGIPYRRVSEKLGSVGLAFTGSTAEINQADEIGVGELVFYGDSVSMGYAEKAEDLTKGDENKGILYTGDLACIDAEGYIYLKGRKKRFVKMLGVRISLDEMENIIRLNFPGWNIVCAGEDNHIAIFYENEINENKLIRFCENKFLIRKKMIEVKRIKEIPRNPYGKVKYSEIQNAKADIKSGNV